jgi:hypothetical protein
MAASNALTLTVIQRIKLKEVLGQAPGRSIGESRLTIKCMDKLEFSEAEIDRWKVKPITIGATGQSITTWVQGEWDDLKAEIEFSKDEYKRLHDFFEVYAPRQNNELTEWLGEVLEQLGL